jgi:hypothetical protein
VALAGRGGIVNMGCVRGSGRKISHPANTQMSNPPPRAISLRGVVQNSRFAAAAETGVAETGVPSAMVAAK